MDERFDFDKGKGGAWITADGSVHYVHRYAGHEDTAHRLWDHGYYDALSEGAIRFSLDVDKDRTAMVHINFLSSKLTEEAISTLLRVMGQAKRRAWANDEFAIDDEDGADDRLLDERSAEGHDRIVRLLVDLKARLRRQRKEAEAQVPAPIYDDLSMWSFV